MLNNINRLESKFISIYGSGCFLVCPTKKAKNNFDKFVTQFHEDKNVEFDKLLFGEEEIEIVRHERPKSKTDTFLELHKPQNSSKVNLWVPHDTVVGYSIEKDYGRSVYIPDNGFDEVMIVANHRPFNKLSSKDGSQLNLWKIHDLKGPSELEHDYDEDGHKNSLLFRNKDIWLNDLIGLSCCIYIKDAKTNEWINCSDLSSVESTNALVEWINGKYGNAEKNFMDWIEETIESVTNQIRFGNDTAASISNNYVKDYNSETSKAILNKMNNVLDEIYPQNIACTCCSKSYETVKYSMESFLNFDICDPIAETSGGKSYKVMWSEDTSEKINQFLTSNQGSWRYSRAIMQIMAGETPHYKQNHLLLHGPPGNGKTITAKEIAKRLKVPFLELSSSVCISRYGGGNSSLGVSKRINAADLLNKLITTGLHTSIGSVLFLDEVEQITRDRQKVGNHEEDYAAVTTAFLPYLDGADNKGKSVAFPMIIGATNHIDKIDPAIKSRFNPVHNIAPPNLDGRKFLIQNHLDKAGLDAKDDEFINELAELCEGNTGRDVKQCVAIDIYNKLENVEAQLAQGQPEENIKNIIEITKLDKEIFDKNMAGKRAYASKEEPQMDLGKSMADLASLVGKKD